MLWWIEVIFFYSHGHVLFVVVWVRPEQQVLAESCPAFIATTDSIILHHIDTLISNLLQPTTSISLFIIVIVIAIVIAHDIKRMINFWYPLLLLPLSL